MPNNNQITPYTPTTLPSILLPEISTPATFSAITQISNISSTPSRHNYLTTPDMSYLVIPALRSISVQERNSQNFISEAPQRERWFSAPSGASAGFTGAAAITEMALSVPNTSDLLSLLSMPVVKQYQHGQAFTLADRVSHPAGVTFSQPDLVQQASGDELPGSTRIVSSVIASITPATVIQKLDKNLGHNLDINKVNLTAKTIKHHNFYQLDFSKLNNTITEKKIEQFTRNKYPVVITGNSGMSYDKERTAGSVSDWDRVQAQLRVIYDKAIEKHGKEKVVIVCGGTHDNGICDLSADIAAEKKLPIFGIASSQAVSYQCLSDKYTMVFVINSESWEVPGSDNVSLMATMATKGEMHAIEGGEITLSELKAARALGIEPTVHVGYAADPEQIKKRTRPGFDSHPVRTWHNANKQ